MFRGAEAVPAFIYGSETLIPAASKGTTYDGQMHVTDWLPTLLGLATGGEWTGSLVGNDIDGADMWDAILSKRHDIRSFVVLTATNVFTQITLPLRTQR